MSLAHYRTAPKYIVTPMSKIIWISIRTIFLAPYMGLWGFFYFNIASV